MALLIVAAMGRAHAMPLAYLGSASSAAHQVVPVIVEAAMGGTTEGTTEGIMVATMAAALAVAIQPVQGLTCVNKAYAVQSSTPRPAIQAARDQMSALTENVSLQALTATQSAAAQTSVWMGSVVLSSTRQSVTLHAQEETFARTGSASPQVDAIQPAQGMM